MRSRVAGGMLALLLAGCGGVLPHESQVDVTKFETYDQLTMAYNKIELGKTSTTDLSTLGFDPKTTPNIEVLSYTQIVDALLPSDKLRVEDVPTSARPCLQAQNDCSGYLYRLAHSSKRRNGDVVPDLMGIERDTVSSGWSADIMLLVQNDRVIYKMMSSKPRIENRQNKSQPLGPLQDMGNINPVGQ